MLADNKILGRQRHNVSHPSPSSSQVRVQAGQVCPFGKPDRSSGNLLVTHVALMTGCSVLVRL
jgi:hypothetical protein